MTTQSTALNIWLVFLGWRRCWWGAKWATQTR